MSFYGRGKPATFLTFDKIYPSYTEMMESVANDEVFLSRYVLIEYDKGDGYETNAAKDSVNYDSTVWKKVKNSDGTLTYIKIADLNTTNPGFTIELTEPSDTPKVELEKADNDKNEYTIKMPKPWGFKQGDLEFNEKGFNPDIHYIDNREDKIAVEDDGDAKKWSIVLPSVGNSIAEVWDIIYGAAANDEARNTDIAWDSYSGLRLINRDENGYTFDKDNVATIAGCINSVHDLMGQIIVDDVNSGVDPMKIEDASTDCIYYRTNENGQNVFCIKDRTYELIAGDPEAEEAPVLHQYEQGVYHNKVLDNYILAEDDYDAGKSYYHLYEEEVLKAIEIDDQPYVPGKFWEGIPGGYQKLEYTDFIDEATYYDFEIGKEIQQITDSIKDIDADTGELRLFFKAEKPPIEVEEDEILQGLFYLEEGKDEYKPVVSTTTVSADKSFFWIRNYEIADGVDVVTEQPTKVYDVKDATKIPVIIVEKPEEYYMYDEPNHCLFIEDVNNYNKKYYAFVTEPKAFKTFYRPKTYYYTTDDKTFIFGTEDKKVPNVMYYKITKELEPILFYEPNKYYYEENGKFIIDESDSLTKNRVYYNYSELYVVSDEENILTPGAPWSSGADVPPGVVVGGRKEIYVWKELKGFANNLNTIHGLIIALHKILKTGDTITRDRDTVQGCINAMNDILDRINALTPGCLVATDKYNRFVTTQLIDVPLSGYESPNFGEEILVNPEDTLKAALQRIETKYADLTSDGHGVKVEPDSEEGMFKLTLI